MYDHLKETLNEYEVIMCRWPGYVSVLENVCSNLLLFLFFLNFFLVLNQYGCFICVPTLLNYIFTSNLKLHERMFLRCVYIRKRPLQMLRKRRLKLWISSMLMFCYHWRTTWQTNYLAINIYRNYLMEQLTPILSQMRWLSFCLYLWLQRVFLSFFWTGINTDYALFLFQLGILLNSMKRLLDVLWPKIDTQLKSWSSCIPDDGHAVKGEYLNDVTVTLRTNFRIYKKAIVQKLAENVSSESI